MRRALLLLTMVVPLSLGALVRADDDLVLSRFSDFLDSLRRQTGIPGLAAAIVGPADVTWERAYGLQDIGRNIAARLDTPFQLDGTTETIAASLALGCAADGWLSLDDTVGKFDPQSPDAGTTLRHLLSHTTGGPNGLAFSYRPDRLAPLAAAVAKCTGSTFRFGVGELFDRVAMIDSVPGADVVRLAAPAEGFTASRLQHYADVVRRLATPYAVDSRGRATASTHAAPALTPASGLISTVRDLEQFDLALKDDVIVPPEMLALAWTPPLDANGQQLPHGLGWFVQTYGRERIVWQFGVGDNQSSSMMITIPRRGLTLILLANSQGLVRPFPLAAGDVTVSPFARLFLSIFAR